MTRVTVRPSWAAPPTSSSPTTRRLFQSGRGARMAACQKYSLRWNDFNLNVASTFRDLHVRQVSVVGMVVRVRVVVVRVVVMVSLYDNSAVDAGVVRDGDVWLP